MHIPLETEQLIREARLSPAPLLEIGREAWSGFVLWLTFSLPPIMEFVQDRLDQTWWDEFIFGLGLLFVAVRQPEFWVSLRSVTDTAFYGLGVEATKRGVKGFVKHLRDKTAREYGEVSR